MTLALAVLALAAVFAFPWPYALFLALAASLSVPVFGIILGMLYDALYLSSAHIPYGTIFGGIISLAALFMRRFLTGRFADFSA